MGVMFSLQLDKNNDDTLSRYRTNCSPERYKEGLFKKSEMQMQENEKSMKKLNL